MERLRLIAKLGAELHSGSHFRKEILYMKILIADDDAAIRYTLQEICSYAGWSTKLCTNGHEALDTFSKESANLIVLDYHMPTMDGLQTVQEIRKLDSDVPILILTVDERQEIANRFLEE